MQTVLHLTPPSYRCQAPVQNRKKHREIERFCSKPKETSRNREKQIQDNVLVSCKQSVGQIVFLFFPPISRGFFRFWAKSFDCSMFFLILDRFFRIPDVFFFRFWTPSFDFSMFLTYKVSPAGSSQDKTICSKSFNTGQLCKEELRRFSKTKQQENQRCGLQVTASSTESLASSQLAPSPAQLA